jgi:hypothetical protein
VSKVVSLLEMAPTGQVAMRMWEVPDEFELVPGPDWVEQSQPALPGMPAMPAAGLPWSR